jgi:hypothetical protein
MSDYQKTYELYDDWNEEKEYAQFAKKPNQNFRAGEIWWVEVGVNLGFEIDGKHENFERPVLILKKIPQPTVFGVAIDIAQSRRLVFQRDFIQQQGRQCDFCAGKDDVVAKVVAQTSPHQRQQTCRDRQRLSAVSGRIKSALNCLRASSA